MTLSEMAVFICGKVNQTEAEDISACKGFLRARRDMVWADRLWKDSVVELTQTLSPDGYDATKTWLPSKGVLLLPPIIERVLAVRTSERTLNAQSREYFYRIDYDAFAQSGCALDYVLLPKCVWEFDTAQYVRINRESVSDAGTSVTTEVIQTDAVSVTRSISSLSSADQFLAQTDRVDRMIKPETSGFVKLNVTSVLNQGVKNDTDSEIAFSISSDGDIFNAPTIVVEPGETGLFSGIIEIRGPGVFYDIPGGTDFVGTLTFDGTQFTPDSPETIVTLAASDTSAPLRQRIRLVEIPTQETTIRVLGKRTPPAFTDDNDEPGLSGADNCLLAFGQADMLERERQYSKAKDKFDEAMLLLDQLVRQETVQQAHNARLIPGGGYGDDNVDGFPTKSTFF